MPLVREVAEPHELGVGGDDVAANAEGAAGVRQHEPRALASEACFGAVAAHVLHLHQQVVSRLFRLDPMLRCCLFMQTSMP